MTPVAAANPSAHDDPLVVQALETYLAELASRRTPDRAAFLARHAAIAGPLADCLAGLEMLHRASARPTAPALHPPEAGQLGDFLLIREVGRGGMGVVYEAEQVSLDRRVALKVLPFAAALDGKQLQRFKNEAPAAAHLHHTHILPGYAVGCALDLLGPRLADGAGLEVAADLVRVFPR